MRRLGCLLAIVLLACSSALSQPNHDSDAQKAEQSQPIAPNANPDAKTAPAGTSHSADDRQKHKEQCEYRGPAWLADFYCFFALHDKFWVAFGTLILAVSTGVLGFATVFLWRATKRLVKGADQNAERQLRPYVFLALAKITDAATRPVIQIKFKNFGQTPAYEAISWVEGQLREYPLTSPLQRRHSNKSSRIAMGPTGLFETGTEWDGSISETDRAALTAGTKAIYIFGQIEYRDTFGKHWFTEFRFMEGGEFPFRPNGGDLPHSPEGNHAT